MLIAKTTKPARSGLEDDFNIEFYNLVTEAGKVLACNLRHGW